MTIRRHLDARRPGFTLIELLVVMGIIAIVGSIVLVGFRGLSREARLSSGTNAVLSALGNARAQAMKTNRLVLVTFWPRLLEGGTQVVEVVTAQWSGDSYSYFGPAPDNRAQVIDRFVPIQGVPVRQLPRGIKVAGPMYAESSASTILTGGVPTGDRDSFWGTQAHLPAINQTNALAPNNEAPGRLIAVMFSPDGSVVGANPQSDSTLAFVDIYNDLGNRGDLHHRGDIFFEGLDVVDILSDVPVIPAAALAEHSWGTDEPVVSFVPYLSVFDDDQARNIYVGDAPADNPWRFDNRISGVQVRDLDLRLYLTENANRIHFNSYSGVAMR